MSIFTILFIVLLVAWLLGRGVSRGQRADSYPPHCGRHFADSPLCARS